MYICNIQLYKYTYKYTTVSNNVPPGLDGLVKVGDTLGHTTIRGKQMFI